MENAATPDPLIGSTFGAKYRIMEKIGSGGMGGVYLAEHLLMHRHVALKLLRSNMLEDETLQKRFHNEAKAASQISHPNAVTLFDFGVEEGVPYLVMEYIQGRTLKLLLESEKPLALDRVSNILTQLSEALHAAHRLGIIHRDIKPDNFMIRVDHEGREVAKVLDFGIAKSIGPSNMHPESNLTQVGMLVGTPQYMSPEQCQGKELDFRSDVYSLGTVVYEMVTGEPPFRAPSVLELLVRVLNSPAESMRAFKPELNIPQGIDAVVLRALEKDPTKRFPTVLEFGKAFHEALDAAHPKTPPPKNRKFVWVGAGAALILVMGFVFGRSNPVPPPLPGDQNEIHARELQQAELEKQKLLERAAKEKEEAERARQETEKVKAEREEVARKAEEEKNAALKQAAAAKEEAERQTREMQQMQESERQKALEAERNQEAMKQAAAAQEVELRRREEQARQADAEKSAALKKAEAAQQELQRQAEAAKNEAARMAETARKMEQEKAELLKRMQEAERRQTAPGASPVPSPLQQLSADEQKKLDETIRKANEQRMEALKRAEQLKREAEQQALSARVAAEQARRARAEAEARAAEATKRREEQEQRAAATPKPAATAEPSGGEEAPKARRRCGPTWCL